jgi:DnaJ homolog subfamily C member 19
VIRVLLVVLVVVLAVWAGRAFRRLDPKARKRTAKYALYAAGGAILLLVLTRSGMHWLGVAGAAVWAALRALAPLAIRLLPFAARLGFARSRTKNEQGAASGAGFDEGNAGHASATAQNGMSRQEALDVLGVREGATRDEVISAYRHLIRKVHPDAPGGSTYLATKLNQAKDVLLA